MQYCLCLLICAAVFATGYAFGITRRNITAENELFKWKPFRGENGQFISHDRIVRNQTSRGNN